MYPRQKAISMLSLDPMLQQSNIMYKITFPPCKGRPFILKNAPIPLLPNMPTCRDHDFHEKRFGKTPPSLSNSRLQISTPGPINLKIIPYPMTEVTCKEEM
jgi:hypothetical protein